MISLYVKDTKNFMNKLLIENTFDFFSVSEIQLTTFCTFNINGHIATDYYESDDFETLKDKEYTSWSKLRPVCFNLIKGSKTPKLFKLTMRLASKDYPNILAKSGASLSPENITGLYLHLIYEEGKVNIITATSLNIFTMDKTLDHYWDETIRSFLYKHFEMENRID